MVGRKYILGNHDLTLKKMLDMLSEIGGIPSPRLKLPHWVPLVAATVDSNLARWTERIPCLSVEGVRMSRKPMHYDASRAIEELGLPQRPVRRALERAVAWFREAGHVTAPGS